MPCLQGWRPRAPGTQALGRAREKGGQLIIRARHDSRYPVLRERLKWEDELRRPVLLCKDLTQCDCACARTVVVAWYLSRVLLLNTDFILIQYVEPLTLAFFWPLFSCHYFTCRYFYMPLSSNIPICNHKNWLERRAL